MKTSELTGAALDWAVCEATGMLKAYTQFRSGKNFLKVYGVARNKHLHPSTNWSQGGPIIEREEITVGPWTTSPFMAHRGAHMAIRNDNPRFVGPTPLIAAMRCFVASKMGDEIDIPEELCNHQIDYIGEIIHLDLKSLIIFFKCGIIN